MVSRAAILPAIRAGNDEAAAGDTCIFERRHVPVGCDVDEGASANPEEDWAVFAEEVSAVFIINESSTVDDACEALHLRSEKLAISYALTVQTHRRIDVRKTTRAYPDCHATYKRVSTTFKRDIWFRDASRVHRFHNSDCSCDDDR